MGKERYFPDELELRNAGMRGDVRLFRIVYPFTYRSSLGVITVPAGFITDGASIPRAFWNLLAPFGDYFEAAVIHDYLYSEFESRFTRLQADQIFKEAMFNAGLDWPRREMIYRAVRMFGTHTFKGKRP